MNTDLRTILEADKRAFGLVATLIQCGGFYRTPRKPDGIPLGPYARYADGVHCGDVYIDIGMLEIEMPNQIWKLAQDFAGEHHYTVTQDLGATAVLSVPSGGIDFGFALACALGLRRLTAQKLITKPSADGNRSEYDFVLDRHNINLEGMRIITAEDIVNNKTSSGAIAKLAERHGATVVGTACIWDRSTVAIDGPPVVSLIRVPLWQCEVVDAEMEGIEIVKVRDCRAKIRNLMEKYPL